MGLPDKEALHSIATCGDDMKRTWLVIAGLAILIGGVLAGAWLTQRGILFSTAKSQRVVASAVSAPPPVRETTETAKAQDVEVTVPAESVDRMHLEVANVTGGTVNTEVRVPGTVQANAYKEVHVTPIAGGAITQVSAELGQSVKRGQPIAQVFSRDLAEARVTAFLATSAELEAEHKNLERTQDLLRMGATPRKELERVEANHQVHAAHLEEARQKLLLLGLDPTQIERLSAGQQVSTYISVLSPIDGIVTTRGVNLGQVVGLGQDLFTVTDLSTVWVEGSVLEDDFSVVRVGSHATITTPAHPGRIYRGVVDYIEPRLDPQTRTAKVRVTIENPGLALRMGMYVDLAFTNVQAGKVVIAPKAAIQRVASDSVVYLPVALKEGRFLQRVVRLDEESGGGFRVLEGLAQGDTVVTEGSVLLRAESLRQHPQ